MLEERNRLLRIMAEERARELQNREAELSHSLAAMSQRIAELEKHNRLAPASAPQRSAPNPSTKRGGCGA
jgi:hypothetical protein